MSAPCPDGVAALGRAVRLMVAAGGSGLGHAWMSAGDVFTLRGEPLPADVDPRDMVHATRGEIHLTSDCGPTCPSVER